MLLFRNNQALTHITGAKTKFCHLLAKVMTKSSFPASKAENNKRCQEKKKKKSHSAATDLCGVALAFVLTKSSENDVANKCCNCVS